MDGCSAVKHNPKQLSFQHFMRIEQNSVCTSWQNFRTDKYKTILEMNKTYLFYLSGSVLVLPSIFDSNLSHSPYVFCHCNGFSSQTAGRKEHPITLLVLIILSNPTFISNAYFWSQKLLPNKFS